MAATNNAESTVSVHGHKADPEKTPASDSGLGVGRETERVPANASRPTAGAKPGDPGPPDGRLVAWSVVWEGGAAPSPVPAGSTTDSGAFPLGVDGFQQYYEVGLLKDYSSSEIAWIPSLQLFFLFALGPVVGIIYDN
ncbi:hypothetical protein F4823DRAFT_566853 [Ustulina deusta]|nr:hypothetical protein F4823DRAFT_566853 [Ustulina deusta]